MVNVSVGEQYGVDAIGVDGKRLPVALSQLFLSLVEPTVDENPSAWRTEQKATARNRLGCTQKFQNCSASRSTQTYPEACIWHADCSKRDSHGVSIDSRDGAVLHSARHSVPGEHDSLCLRVPDTPPAPRCEPVCDSSNHPLSPIQPLVTLLGAAFSLQCAGDLKDVAADGLLGSESCLMMWWGGLR